MIEPRFSDIFGPELAERLRWFSALRWIAVAGLAGVSLAGPRIGLTSVWPSLFVVAALVAASNLVVLTALRRSERGEVPYANMRASAIAQMVMDLFALTVCVHFTGGLTSPLLPFYAFHMAIGTIMIKTSLMYGMASITTIGMLVLYLLEGGGVLPAHPLLADWPRGGWLPGGFNMAVMPIALFGIVYLTDSVTSRFKERSIELHQTSEQVRQRGAELARLLAEKEELERRKSHYMRISAHQLRSPLGTIKTSLQVLLDGYLDPGSERGRKLLAGAADRVGDLLLIVNDLLELAKMREGRSKAPWTRQVYINQVLADIFDAQEPFASERKVTLVPDIQGVAKLEWGVPPDLVYAFENLVHNAIKYSKPDGGTVTVRLRVVDEVARVEVMDHGIGIPADVIDNVFLEFVRAPNAKQHVREGTGLGLSIVDEAIRMHGGRVAVASVEGEGSTFTVSLPLHFVPPEVARSEPVAEPPH